MYLHILDADKRTLLDEDLPADPAAFLDAVAPYRQGLVVGARVHRQFRDRSRCAIIAG
jgi:hypothetical protein